MFFSSVPNPPNIPNIPNIPIILAVVAPYLGIRGNDEVPLRVPNLDQVSRIGPDLVDRLTRVPRWGPLSGHRSRLSVSGCAWRSRDPQYETDRPVL